MPTTSQQDSPVTQRDQQALAELTVAERKLGEDIEKQAADLLNRVSCSRQRWRLFLSSVSVTKGTRP